MRSGGVKVALEHTGVFGADLRRADLSTDRFVDGGPLVADITVTAPHAVSNVAGAAKEQGFACRQREQSKNTTYRGDALKRGLRFEPLVFETFGHMGNQLMTFLNQLLNYVALDVNKRHSRGVEEYSRTFLTSARQTLSIGLQRGNASAILRKAAIPGEWGAGGAGSNPGRVFDPDVIRPRAWTSLESSLGSSLGPEPQSEVDHEVVEAEVEA